MIIYEIEKSLNGICSAIFNSFIKREVPDVVTSKNQYQVGFSTKIYSIKSDAEHAERVKTAIMNYANEHTLDMIMQVLRSNSDTACLACFNYVKRLFDLKRDIAFDLADPVVIEFNELRDKVWLEVHRFKGFLRFSETENGVLYAHFSPDNDILELLIPHFKNRYKHHAFVIHDIKRNRVATYDTEKVKVFTPDKPLSIYLNEKELDTRSLWKEYFSAVNIKSRKNTRQQKQYMPVRYWNNLTEFEAGYGY